MHPGALSVNCCTYFTIQDTSWTLAHKCHETPPIFMHRIHCYIRHLYDSWHGKIKEMWFTKNVLFWENTAEWSPCVYTRKCKQSSFMSWNSTVFSPFSFFFIAAMFLCQSETGERTGEEDSHILWRVSWCLFISLCGQICWCFKQLPAWPFSIPSDSLL